MKSVSFSSLLAVFALSSVTVGAVGCSAAEADEPGEAASGAVAEEERPVPASVTCTSSRGFRDVTLLQQGIDRIKGIFDRSAPEALEGTIEFYKGETLVKSVGPLRASTLNWPDLVIGAIDHNKDGLLIEPSGDGWVSLSEHGGGEPLKCTFER